MIPENEEGVDLARRLQSGEIDVFTELMKQYQFRVYQIAWRITKSPEDAEDVMQETFLQVLKKIASWKGESFNGWLFRIARNFAIDCIRRRYVSQKEYLPAITHPGVSSGASRQMTTSICNLASLEQLPVDTVLQKEQQHLVNLILKELPVGQREVIYLRHFQGLSIAEIAQRRKCAEGTVKATLFQTFQKLKDRFKSAGLME